MDPTDFLTEVLDVIILGAELLDLYLLDMTLRSKRSMSNFLETTV